MRLVAPAAFVLGLVLLAGAASAGRSDVTPIGTKVVVGANPSAVAISPGGKVVYVTAAQISSPRGSLAFVNAATRQVTRKVRVGQNPEAVAVSRSGAQAFVANYGSNTVSVVNTKTGAVRGFEAGQHPASLLDVETSRGELLFVANGGPVQPPRGTIQVVAVKTLKTIKTIKLKFNPSALAALPNGRTVYVGNANAPSVTTLDTAKLGVRRNVKLTRGAPVNGLAVSLDRERLYVATLDSTMVLSTNTMRTLTIVPADNPGDPLGIATGPKSIALVANGQGEASQPDPGTLTVIKGTRHLRAVGPLGYFAGDVAITPNGRSTWVTNFGIGSGGYVLIFPTPSSS
jgi:YVTN family beta-propeller protein